MKTKNSWYHTTFGVVVLLILFFPAGLYLMWKYTNWDKRVKLGILGVIILFLLIGALSPDSKKAESPNTLVVAQSSELPKSIEESSKLLYEIIEKKDEANLANYKILISTGVDAKSVSTEVKKSCSKPCNISIYDDKKALELEIEYDKMIGDLNSTPSAIQNWRKENYVYIADHLIGYMTFDSEEWLEYPYKDWYYKELKGE